MKRAFSIIILVVLLAALSGSELTCDEGSKADIAQREETDRLMVEAHQQIGMPNIVNFQQKKPMRQVYELCDKEDLVCYAYLKSDYTGEFVFLGKCIGFGIPFSAQFTNPERLVHDGSLYATLPQPDPNGLFMPTASSATWLMMIDPETSETHPVYIEPEIVVSPFPLL